MVDNPEDAIAAGDVSMTPEIYANGEWSSLFGAYSREAFGPDFLRASFPHAFVAPNGQVFGISADKMWYLDASGNGEITYLGNFKQPYGNLADPVNVGALSVAVMYDVGKILQAGGNGGHNGDGFPGSDMATVIDINSSTPQLFEQARMHFPRRYGNGVVLASGEVVVTGGTTLGNFYAGAERERGSEAVYAAEIWHPETGEWRVAASAATIRVYHSTSSLLLNGTVFSAGGGTPGPVLNKEGEIFYPPYLFQQNGVHSQLAMRPEIVGISGVKYAHGAPLQLDMRSAEALSSVVLIGLSNGTHSFNSGQRRIPLSFTQQAHRISATIPNANLAPPGYYQLVILNQQGVPSYGVVLAIGEQMAPPNVAYSPYDPTNSEDSDGDGVPDIIDAFPNDPNETGDADNDGVGDNSDAFPNNSSETTDSDGDGVGDNADAFPHDPAETQDSDDDGIGNNTDPSPYGGLGESQVGAWRFNEASGNDIADGSGSGANLIATNMAWAEGLESSAGVFNGVNSEANTGRALVDTASSFSVSVWVKLNQLTGWRTFVNQDGDNISGFWLQYSSLVNGGKFALSMHEADGNSPAHRAISNTTPTLGRWYHVVGVRDKANNLMQLYVDGELEATHNYNGGWSANGSLNIGRGRWFGNADWFDGEIDGVSVYNKALNSDEIALLFADKGGVVTLPPDSDGDGVSDVEDAFPNDASETQDSDGDGVGDNADAFPKDATETTDSDGDGVGDNADAFPNDPNQSIGDRDGDGLNDAIDIYPDDASRGAGIWREVYLSIAGTAVGDLTAASKFPANPDEVEPLATFEGPSDWADRYGTRIHGMLKAPQSGAYTFWVAGDDNAQLNISSNSLPVNKREIASVPGWTPPRVWDKYPQQQSATVNLIAGERYYLEVLQKEGGGGDNVAVAWQRPGDSNIEMIDEQHLVSATVYPSILPPISTPIIASGSTVTFSLDLNLADTQYRWDFGDGSPELSTNEDEVQHTYHTPGLYLITLRAELANGVVLTRNYRQAVATDRTAQAPQRSSAIAVDAENRVWVVNPDNDTVSVFDTQNYQMLAEIATGKSPRQVAIAANGDIWVSNKFDASLSVISGTHLSEVQRITLPRASQPHGLLISPVNNVVYVVLEASGELFQLHAGTGEILHRLALGPHIRHLALSDTTNNLLVSRFITPALPGESSFSVETSSQGGEVLVVNTLNMKLEKTISLRYSDKVNNAVQGSGVPNYLSAPAISPDGKEAWVPSKQDNITRGMARNGEHLDFQNTVRAVSSNINLLNVSENYSRRIDHDNASLASAAVFHPSGVYLFVALETSREVAVINAFSGAELFRIAVERAPQGLAVSANGETLYVQNYMSRSVSFVDLENLLQLGEFSSSQQHVRSTNTEALAAQVLLGKQLFYDAADDRLARDNYMSCATCHNDGGGDGRVWDLSGFGEGLRNTIDLNGRAAMSQGFLHWSGNFDELQDFENQIRLLAGGTGLMTDAQFSEGTRSEALGDNKAGVSEHLDALAAYVSSLEHFAESPYRTQNGALTSEALAGRAVFIERQCANCHGGPHFTNSGTANLMDVGTVVAESGKRLGGSLMGIDIPTLRDVWKSAPYLHNGRAMSLAEAIVAHQVSEIVGSEIVDAEIVDVEIESLEMEDLDNLVAFLKQIGSEEAAVDGAPVSEE